MSNVSRFRFAPRDLQTLSIPNSGFNVRPLKSRVHELDGQEKERVDSGKALFHMLGQHIQSEKVPDSSREDKKLPTPAQNHLELHPVEGTEFMQVHDHKKSMKKGGDVLTQKVVTVIRKALYDVLPKGLGLATPVRNDDLFVILGTQKGALEQAVHFDTTVEGEIVVASADGQVFYIGLIPYSHLLIRAIRRIRKFWKALGCPAPVNVEPEVTLMSSRFEFKICID